MQLVEERLDLDRPVHKPFLKPLPEYRANQLEATAYANPVSTGVKGNQAPCSRDHQASAFALEGLGEPSF